MMSSSPLERAIALFRNFVRRVESSGIDKIRLRCPIDFLVLYRRLPNTRSADTAARLHVG